MLIHYLKIGIRNLAKQKALAFINVFGLSVGIACFSLFLLYAVNEFSYDRFHKNSDQIFRVVQWWTGNKDRGPSGDPSSFTPLGPAMKSDFPDVENFVRFQSGWSEKFAKVNNKISRTSISFADPKIFSVFSFKLLSGNPDQALREPHNIVLTRNKAMQLFGQINVIGKIVEIKIDEQFESFKISAVAENIPTTSSLQFDILGSFDYIANSKDGIESANNWYMTIGIETYVQLHKGSHLMNEPERLAKFRSKYYPNEQAELKKAGIWDGKGPLPASFILQPLRDMHTDTKIEDGPPGALTDPKNIFILVSIAAGILLIACINFTTLAIGRSAGRAKEIGVRKVIGGARKQLIYQFLTESILLSILSGALGLMLANMLLPYFNQLSGRQLNFSINQFPEIGWMLAGLILLVGFLAGSYPALVLSGFKPIDVLKSKIKIGGSNIFTKSLVTFQFVLSIGLIISTLIIFQQLHFLRAKNLGFTKENVIVVDAWGADTKKIYPLFREGLQSKKEILGVAGSEMGLGEGEGQMGDGYDFNGKFIGVIEYPIDATYLHVMGMQLIAGRNFDPSISSDTVHSVIINEAMAKNDLGMSPEKSIGQQFKNKREGTIKTVIGVIKNFNFEPLNRMVRSQLFMMPANFQPSKFFVRIKPGDPTAALSGLESTWKMTAADLPFKYSFLDEDLDRFYKSEEKWSSIVGWAGGVSIFLACLGLFGLASLAAVNRTKEIGIRKVLGATVYSIVQLLSKDFLKLVMIALIIASPLAWYFMNKWLQDYAYRINIGWWVFAITGTIALLIALITISFQAIKVAIADPVKSLRTE